MYTPASFRQDDLAALHAQMQANPFALLASAGSDGVQASHLPLLLEPGEGEFGTLYGHFAKANPHWRGLQSGAEALAVFSGPDAYISPGWYPAKAEHGKVVPTWNYIAVHARGPVELIEDPERLLQIVSRLSDRHGAAAPSPGRSTMRRASTSTPCCAPSSASPCRSAVWRANGSSGRTARPSTRPACATAWPPRPNHANRPWPHA